MGMRDSGAGETGHEAATAIDPWRLQVDGLDPARAALEDTLFALANGSLGIRGDAEESVDGAGGTFLAAAYAQSPIHYHERLSGFAARTDTRVPVCDGTRIEVWLGDRRLDPAACTILQARRSLHLRTGRLSRHLRLRTPDGEILSIHAERVVPLDGPDLLAIRYAIVSETYRGPLRLVSCLLPGGRAAAQGDDPRIGAGSGEGLHDLGGDADANAARWSQSGRGGALQVRFAQCHRPGDGLRFVASGADDGRAFQAFEAACTPGAEIVLEKCVVHVAGDDAGAPDARLADALAFAQSHTFEAHAQRQANALQAFWEGADLSVPGAPEIEQALRFNLFHVLQSAGRSGFDGTAAKGLTGEGYEGHCFWDTEAFVLPVMAFVAPEVALAMLRWRHRTLDAARAHARELNHATGALYPWRTIAGGECSAHYPSGSAAYHINAAVAHAIGLYLDATGDLDFLADAGAEMLFETARIWPQAGHFDPRRGGAFCIHDVTGPDEYTTLVDNNHYTNRMAQRHLRRAADAWGLLRRERPQAHATLAARLALEDDEIALWRRAADAMWLGEDAWFGIHAQDDTFLGKPRWPYPEKRDGHRPLLLDYHPITLYRYQVCKQADVVMALALAGDDVPALRKRRSFDYYEALTTHDSTLSAAVHGIVAAAIGEPQRALGYFLDSLRVDLDDLHGNTAHGVHMAAMAGSWLGLAQGFGGLRAIDGALAFAPLLPPGWPSYAFSLHWRGRTLRVDVCEDGATYALVRGEALTLRHEGAAFTLASGETVRHPLGAVAARRGAAFPHRCEALIFDLDGVLVDTARLHYVAWKRLADALGIPFGPDDNERLKGVDRMGSLERILQRADRAYTDEEKRQLAARKNADYVAAIETLGPEDLFPGARELLVAARARGLRVGLASASRNAPRLLERLGIADHFDFVADAGRVRRGKPHPDLFLEAARGLGVAPAACIGIEDAAAGIDALRAACMPAIGIGDAAQLARADVVVPTIADLDLDAFVLPVDPGSPHPP